MGDEDRSCVWCKATVATGPRLRVRKRPRTRLCIKCTLWALAGQTPPYVPPRRESLQQFVPQPTGTTTATL
jgi:hypothetical protein